MTEIEIFETLFKVAKSSNDKKGKVAALIYKDGKILESSASSDDGLYHAEYLVLEKAANKNINLEGAILYTTLEPCGTRNSLEAKKIGDCASHIINSPIKKVVVGVKDPVEGRGVEDRFKKANICYEEVSETSLRDESLKIFNDSCENPKHKIHF